MSFGNFQIVEPGRIGGSGLDPADVALGKRGILRLHVELLDSIGFKDKAVVLIDDTNLRIAVRPARDGEPSYRVKRDKKSSTATVNISKAIRELGFATENFRGRTSPVQKDDWLIVSLVNVFDGADAIDIEELRLRQVK